VKNQTRAYFTFQKAVGRHSIQNCLQNSHGKLKTEMVLYLSWYGNMEKKRETSTFYSKRREI